MVSVLQAAGCAFGLMLVVSACGQVSLDPWNEVDSSFAPVSTTAQPTSVTPMTTSTTRPTTANPATSAAPPLVPPTGVTTTTVVEGDPPFLTEILELRDSAGPGKIVGFISLRGYSNSGSPTSPQQPVCVGVGDFADAQPGTQIEVMADTGDAVIVELRGSSYDAHLGCGLWFGADVPETTQTYTIAIGSFSPVEVTIDELDQHDWLVELWSDEVSLEIYCVEMIEDYEPGVCRLLARG